jgi:hypothetical protein
MLYKFVFAKKSYYDLVMTRQVEPQAQDDRQSEEDAQTTDTTGENERVAMTDGAYLSEGRAFVPLRLGGTVRKKQRWRLPPKTVVRLKNRMHRWDGFLYNIDLFPYVEHRLLAFIG